MKTDLQTRKISFIEEFLKIQNEDAITRLEKLLQKESKKHVDIHLSPMSLDELNLRIDQSLHDSMCGKLIENSDLANEIEGWC